MLSERRPNWGATRRARASRNPERRQRRPATSSRRRFSLDAGDDASSRPYSVVSCGPLEGPIGSEATWGLARCTMRICVAGGSWARPVTRRPPRRWGGSTDRHTGGPGEQAWFPASEEPEGGACCAPRGQPSLPARQAAAARLLRSGRAHRQQADAVRRDHYLRRLAPLASAGLRPTSRERVRLAVAGNSVDVGTLGDRPGDRGRFLPRSGPSTAASS